MITHTALPDAQIILDKMRSRRAALFEPSETKSTSYSNAHPAEQVAQTLSEQLWRDTPAHLQLKLVNAVLQEQARKHPSRLLALSVLAGAAAVYFKPWQWSGAVPVGAFVANLASSDLLKQLSPFLDSIKRSN